MSDGFRVVILMPVYQDWESVAILCGSLDEHLRKLNGVEVRILLVDDGSVDQAKSWRSSGWQAVEQIDCLRLRRNLGHQRAICVGLCYLSEHIPCDAVLVMDADGEDLPEDALRLIELLRSDPNRALFAARRRRQEGIAFRTGYHFFRLLHRMLTGIPVRVGNFSIIPAAALRRLTSMPELWSHYAGAVFRSRFPRDCVPMDRGRRLAGRSHMNFASLVIHGISGIATFNEVVATRILLANIVGLVLLFVALVAILWIRFLTNWSIPGWATYTTGLILVLAIQICATSFGLVFTLISNRTNMTFMPSRDYLLFVDTLEPLSRRG
jgi:glycosyltransferase involved in cell wall biosynthesis